MLCGIKVNTVFFKMQEAVEKKYEMRTVFFT